MQRAAIYLDYAAATPVDKRVVAAMLPYFSEKFFNPSAMYSQAADVAKDMAAARANVAHWLGARPSEVIFTAGGSEANNLAIQGVMRRYPGANVVVSAVEHESVLAPASLFSCKIAPVDRGGIVNVAKLAERIDDKTVLVSIMYANNEVGTIQPIREIAQMISAKRAQRSGKLPLYFHTDAAQAANYLDLHMSRRGVDMLTLNGGKIYGPKQSGALVVRGGVDLQPIIIGGGQERGQRSGTENVAAVIGFTKALELAQQSRHEETHRLQTLQQYFFDHIEQALPQAVINGSRKKRLPNNVHLTIPGADNERLLIQLDEAGIMAAAGSACSASSETSSHVLLAMGLSDQSARSSLRFTMGRATTRRDIDRTVAALKNFIGRSDA
jgi:cysteine desulfurase